MNDEEISIEKLEDEIECLTRQLEQKKELLSTLKIKKLPDNSNNCYGLKAVEISRYSRQIILPYVGLKGQETLKKSSILIVGVGGLGCPAVLYLVSAGIGHIGLVDHDDVEINNLHRQILHTEDDIECAKTESVSTKLKKLNRQTKITNYKCQLTSENAVGILSQYDVILDATDNVASRYLLNDACIFTKKPLVSGSALQLEGQLTVYNHLSSPCYRCLFPQPPPPNTINNCSSSGVLGPVCGVIGVLQALEAIKIVLNMEGVLSGKMLLFDGYDTSFRCIRLRKKKLDCDVCGINPKIKCLIDYEQFCNSPANDKDISSLLKRDERISVDDLFKIRSNREPHLLIDVRTKAEYDMCHLSESLNININSLDKEADSVTKKIDDLKRITDDPKIIFICRRGNDSQKAVYMLKSKLNIKSLYDVEGGFHAWSKNVDNNFPLY